MVYLVKLKKILIFSIVMSVSIFSYIEANPFEENLWYAEESERLFLTILEVKKIEKEKIRQLEDIKMEEEYAEIKRQLQLDKDIKKKEEEYNYIRFKRIHLQQAKKEKEDREKKYSLVRAERIYLQQIDKEKKQRDKKYNIVRDERIRLEKVDNTHNKNINPKREIKKKSKKRPAGRKVIAKIDLSEQTMMVYRDGELLYTWKTSTGKQGYHTPRGNYRPTIIKEMHYSSKYNDAPMPYSVFFKRGYAIHGTTSVEKLGVKSSHGCIRLHTSDAKKFYELVEENGKRYTKIKIVN